MTFSEHVYDEEAEDPIPDAKKVLEYPYHPEFVFDTSVYDETYEYVETEEDKQAPSDVQAM